jgi:hypothetical protein
MLSECPISPKPGHSASFNIHHPGNLKSSTTCHPRRGSNGNTVALPAIGATSRRSSVLEVRPPSSPYPSYDVVADGTTDILPEVPCRNCTLTQRPCTYAIRDEKVIISKSHLERLQAAAGEQNAIGNDVPLSPIKAPQSVTLADETKRIHVSPMRDPLIIENSTTEVFVSRGSISVSTTPTPIPIPPNLGIGTGYVNFSSYLPSVLPFMESMRMGSTWLISKRICPITKNRLHLRACNSSSRH